MKGYINTHRQLVERQKTYIEVQEIKLQQLIQDMKWKDIL